MDEEAIAREIAPAFIDDGGAKTDVVVLGCTHYPLLLDKLDALAPWPVAWLDPAPAIGRRIASLLAGAGHIAGLGAGHGRGQIQFTSGQPPSPALRHLLHSHELTIQAFEAATCILKRTPSNSALFPAANDRHLVGPNEV